MKGVSMRRNFAQILKDAKIDIKEEYHKLYGLLYNQTTRLQNGQMISVNDFFNDNFLNFYFRGTCLSLEEFNEVHGFHFVEAPDDFNIDHLISLCEYMYNMLAACQSSAYGRYQIPINIPFFMNHIQRIIEAVSYTQSNENDMVIFVECSPEAIAVAESELIPQPISYKLISYNHYSMKGNLPEKKHTILQLAEILEGKRSELSKIDNSFTNDLFYLFNNLNLRHNNIDPSIKGKYKKAVAEMSPEEIEHWYDETYQMCLLAFLRLEQGERKIEFDTLKNQIETK